MQYWVSYPLQDRLGILSPNDRVYCTFAQLHLLSMNSVTPIGGHWVKGCHDWFRICKIELCENGIDVWFLGKQDGAGLTIASGFHAREPANGSQVCDAKTGADFGFKVSDEPSQTPCDCAVVNVRCKDQNVCAYECNKYAPVHFHSFEPQSGQFL